MLKYDFFSALRSLSEKSCDAVAYACKKHMQSTVRISRMCDDSHKLLCELEHALFSEFLPPLDRASLAAYAHSLCNITDAALLYSSASPPQHSAVSQKGFNSISHSLCEMLKEDTLMLEKIKKSSDIPRIDEFREKKSRALECLCEGLLTPQAFTARQELLSSISVAFDVLLELILKSI